MAPDLNGKVLFVFSDPGGVKPLLALAERQKHCFVLSDRIHPFYNNFNVTVNIHDKHYDKIINDYQPDFIVTGTSYTSGIEKEIHKLAASEGIKCFAFVDHWTSFRIRFEQEDGSLFIPDQVWVIDERAKQLAIEAGIPENRLVITGNPYHTWLSCWKPDIDKKTFLNQIGLPSTDANLLIFAPDPLSNVDGKTIYGFDEIEAARQIDHLFEKNQIENWLLLVKAHPNQNIQPLKKAFTSKNIFMLPTKADTNSVLYFADAVMGFFSSILIEASILGKPVLRYLPNEISNDPIADLQIGITTDRLQLPSHLQSLRTLV
jgi:hypothetical protein